MREQDCYLPQYSFGRLKPFWARLLSGPFRTFSLRAGHAERGPPVTRRAAGAAFGEELLDVAQEVEDSTAALHAPTSGSAKPFLMSTRIRENSPSGEPTRAWPG